MFRDAWRRFTLIVRGGRRTTINHRLRRLGMPRLLRAKRERAPVYKREHVHPRLPHARVSMIWSPQTIGSPNVRGNQPGDYWPGWRYVDWVGADIYSKFASPGIRAAFTRFYRQYRGRPFAVGEYAPWDNDRTGSFTRWLFDWALQHRRTRMLIYYRSVYSDSPFDIRHYPAARAVLREFLDLPAFMPYAPGLEPGGSP
jgi:hypothetical protein